MMVSYCPQKILNENTTLAECTIHWKFHGFHLQPRGEILGNNLASLIFNSVKQKGPRFHLCPETQANAVHCSL